jgi:hypothetical protein
MSDNVINMPEPLPELARRFREAYARNIASREDWVRSILEMAGALYDARRQFQSNLEFSHWLVENELDYHSKDDRAILIKMGAHIELTRVVLPEINLTWLRRIWHEELQPRLLELSIKNKSEQSAAVDTSDRLRELAKTDQIYTPTEIEPESALAAEKTEEPTSEPAAEEVSEEAKSLRPLSQKSSLRKRSRALEVWSMYLNYNTRAALSKAMRSSGANEIWSLILIAIDQGFLRPSNAASKKFSARLLFTDSPSHSSRFLAGLDLTASRDRKRVSELIMPAAIARREAILAQPEAVENIIDAYGREQTEAAQKAVRDRQHSQALSQMPATQAEIVAFGDRLWPSASDMYDYDQVRAAVWFFRDLERFLSSGRDSSIKSVALMIRNTIKWLSEYTAYRSDQKRVYTIFQLVRRITIAWEQNPKSEQKWPPYPMGGEEGKW